MAKVTKRARGVLPRPEFDPQTQSTLDVDSIIIDATKEMTELDYIRMARVITRHDKDIKAVLSDLYQQMEDIDPALGKQEQRFLHSEFSAVVERIKNYYGQLTTLYYAGDDIPITEKRIQLNHLLTLINGDNQLKVVSFDDDRTIVYDDARTPLRAFHRVVSDAIDHRIKQSKSMATAIRKHATSTVHSFVAGMTGIPFAGALVNRILQQKEQATQTAAKTRGTAEAQRNTDRARAFGTPTRRRGHRRSTGTTEETLTTETAIPVGRTDAPPATTLQQNGLEASPEFDTQPTNPIAGRLGSVTSGLDDAGTKTIIRILTQHTRLLEGLLSTANHTLRETRSTLSRQQLTQEERDLETSNDRTMGGRRNSRNTSVLLPSDVDGDVPTDPNPYDIDPNKKPTESGGMGLIQGALLGAAGTGGLATTVALVRKFIKSRSATRVVGRASKKKSLMAVGLTLLAGAVAAGMWPKKESSPSGDELEREENPIDQPDAGMDTVPTQRAVEAQKQRIHDDNQLDASDIISAGAEIAGKGASLTSKVATKAAPKVAGKVLGKIPVLSLLVGGYSAYQRLKDPTETHPYASALTELVSGILPTVLPGAGIIPAMALDAGLVGYDVNRGAYDNMMGTNFGGDHPTTPGPTPSENPVETTSPIPPTAIKPGSFDMKLPVEEGTIAFADATRKLLGKDFNRITAFTGGTHTAGGSHYDGRAFDMTIADPRKSAEVAGRIRTMAKSMGLSGVNGQIVVDEYKSSSRHKTGAHLHVQLTPNDVALLESSPEAATAALSAPSPVSSHTRIGDAVATGRQAVTAELPATSAMAGGAGVYIGAVNNTTNNNTVAGGGASQYTPIPLEDVYNSVVQKYHH